MRYLGMRTLTEFLPASQPGPDGVDLQALLERVPPAVVTELAVDILGADAHGADRPLAGDVVPDRRRRARRTTRASWVGTFLNARAGTIYAGTSPGPAQHHRRDGARPPQGAPAADAGAWRETSRGDQAALTPAVAPSRVGRRVARVLVRVRRCGRPRCVQLFAARRRRAGGGGRRSSRCPIRTTSGSACRPPTATTGDRPSRPTSITYLHWCRQWPSRAA